MPIHARSWRDLLHEIHIVAKPPEPEHPAQTRPGRPAVPWLVRKRTAYDNQ